MSYCLSDHDDKGNTVQVLFKLASEKPEQFKLLYNLAVTLSKYGENEETEFVLHSLRYNTLGQIADLIDRQGEVEEGDTMMDFDEEVYNVVNYGGDESADYFVFIQNFITKYSCSNYIIPEGLNLDTEEEEKRTEEAVIKLQELVHISFFNYFSELITGANLSFDIYFTPDHPLRSIELGGILTAILGDS